ncbi:MAG: alpha/beta fold hydrolase [Burkholderiales bacterium]
MNLLIQDRPAYVYTGTRALVEGQRTVMFIHGAANDHSVWALQSRYFAYHGWNVLALDLPGHGKSAEPLLTTIEAMASWCSAALTQARIESTAVVGHSMGSLIALELAARHPQQVSQLVLVGTAFPMKVSDTLLGAAKAQDHAALDMISVWSHSSAGQTGGNRAPGQWIMGSGMRLLERNAKPLHNDFKACNDYTAANESAAKVGCPTLVISGNRDLMTPAKAARGLAGKLPNAQVRLIDGAGHDLMAEQPDQLLDELIGFLG